MCDYSSMQVDLKDGIVSLTDFARNTREHTAELVESKQPRVLTQNGKAALVVLSAEAYEELAHDAEEHRLDMRLREALAKYDAGDRGKPAAKAYAAIQKRAAKRRSKK